MSSAASSSASPRSCSETRRCAAPSPISARHRSRSSLAEVLARSLCVCVCQRPELERDHRSRRDRGGQIGPEGVPVEPAREHDDGWQRCKSASQRGQRGDRRGVGKVHVFDHDQGGLAAGGRRQELAESGIASQGARSVVHLRQKLGVFWEWGEAHQIAREWPLRRGHATQLLRQRSNRIALCRGAEVQGCGAVHHEASRFRQGDQLGREARLANAGLAADAEDCARAATPHVVQKPDQGGKLCLASDQRRAGALGSALEPRQLPDPDRRRQAPHLDVADGLVERQVPGGAVDRVADHRLARAGFVLQARRQIRGVAHHRVGLVVTASEPAGHDLTAGDPDVHSHREPDLAGQRLGASVDLERGAHRALGVVVVGRGGAEQGHHVVADVLVDRAAELGDGAVGPGKELLEQVVDIFGIQRARQPGIAAEVGEQHRDGAPLAGRGALRAHRKPAPAAEGLAGLVEETAGRAGRRERAAALAAKSPSLTVVGVTARAVHPSRPSYP